MSDVAIPYHVDVALESGLEGRGIGRKDALSLMEEAPLETLLQTAAAVRDRFKGNSVQRAGMASGINSTFRQVGIATGIALLGTLFSNKVHSEVVAGVKAVPGLAGIGPRIAAAVQSGKIGSVIGTLPGSARQAVGTITRTAFTTGLNHILLVAAIIALVSGVISLAAIRGKDFAHQQGPAG